MPRLAGPKGKRLFPFNMRTTKDVREKLEIAAAASGRSLTREVEHRLLESIEGDRIAALIEAAVTRAMYRNVQPNMQSTQWPASQGLGQFVTTNTLSQFGQQYANQSSVSQGPGQNVANAMGQQKVWSALNDGQHWSDCAVHNAPALPVGPCDCGTAMPAMYGLVKDDCE